MGKTHLLNSIGIELKKNNKVMFISAERFMYQFVKSIKANEMVRFKEYFRNTDILLISLAAAASNLKSISRLVISLSRKTTSTSFNLLVFFIKDSMIKANSIIASISSLNIFFIFGLKIFIATSLIVPLSFICALCTWAIEAAASGQIPQNSNSYLALSEKKSEMITLRNQTAIGLLLLVILGLLVF